MGYRSHKDQSVEGGNREYGRSCPHPRSLRPKIGLYGPQARVINFLCRVLLFVVGRPIKKSIKNEVWIFDT
jgi:hypothetical protein